VEHTRKSDLWHFFSFSTLCLKFRDKFKIFFFEMSKIEKTITDGPREKKALNKRQVSNGPGPYAQGVLQVTSSSQRLEELLYKWTRQRSNETTGG
jgi:hypothetical protein